MPVKSSFHVYQISGFIQVLGGKTERFGFPCSWKVLGKRSQILKILKVCEQWIIHRKLYELWTFPFTLKSNDSLDTTMVNILASELWGTGCKAWEFKSLYVSRNLLNLALEFRRRQKCLEGSLFKYLTFNYYFFIIFLFFKLWEQNPGLTLIVRDWGRPSNNKKGTAGMCQAAIFFQFKRLCKKQFDAGVCKYCQDTLLQHHFQVLCLVFTHP